MNIDRNVRAAGSAPNKSASLKRTLKGLLSAFIIYPCLVSTVYAENKPKDKVPPAVVALCTKYYKNKWNVTEDISFDHCNKNSFQKVPHQHVDACMSQQINIDPGISKTQAFTKCAEDLSSE